MKLTPELVTRLAELHRLGLPTRAVLDALAIPEASFYRWVRRGRHALAEDVGAKAEVPYVDLVLAVDRAVAEGAASALATIQGIALGGQLVRRTTRPNGTTDETYAVGDWRAAAWFLERRFPRDWGRHALPFPVPERSAVSTDDLLADPVALDLSLRLEERLAGLVVDDDPEGKPA